jgi:hypothetical protein
MAERVRLSGWEKFTLTVTAIGGLILWFALLAAPWIALDKGYLKPKANSDVTDLQAVLGQLGTYGDLFGMLNCLFSGAALWGLIYAVILQRRELHHSHETAEDSRRSTEIQNRIALYQYLAEKRRHEGGKAGEDVLLAARSRGREKAYTELISDLLQELNALAVGERPSTGQRIDLYDHPLRIAILNQRYRKEEDDVRDPSEQFGPVKSLLLELVEEVAALTELNRGNQVAASALLQAGHAINAAIRPQDLLEPEQLDDANYHRGYQIRKAQEAFNAAFHALEAFGALKPLGIKLVRKKPGKASQNDTSPRPTESAPPDTPPSLPPRPES